MSNPESLKQFSERFADRPGKDVPDFTGLDERSLIKAFQQICPDTEDAWRILLGRVRIKLLLRGKPEQMREITAKLKKLDEKGKRRLLGALVALKHLLDSRQTSEWKGI